MGNSPILIRRDGNALPPGTSDSLAKRLDPQHPVNENSFRMFKIKGGFWNATNV
jgi:hypothetical protein